MLATSLVILLSSTAPSPPAPASTPAPALTVPAPATDARLQGVIDAVQTAYDGTNDFSAVFTQKFTNTMLRRTQESSGSVKFKKAGRIRFDYAKPQPKSFVVDGGALWIHQPADKNAFVNACFKSDDQLLAPIAFMWGQGKIREQFDASWFEGTFGDKTDHHVQLVPKKPSGAFAKLILVVDPKTSRVKQSIVVDPAGNVNQLVFTEAKFNAGLPDASFAFAPPAGTHVARVPGSCDAPVAGLSG
jgi:outer membrane lipoprotein carrier protein